MKKSVLLASIAFAVLSLGMNSCNQNNEGNKTEGAATTETAPVGGQASVKDESSQPDIVKVAVGSKDHTTLVAAVQAASLVDVLASSGPYTVFAPTNAAFDQLPKGTVEGLLKPEKKGDLQNILQFHVTTSMYKAESFKDGQVISMADEHNSKVTIHVKDGKVMVNDANIIGSVTASNGIIHVIDKVLLPPAK